MQAEVAGRMVVSKVRMKSKMSYTRTSIYLHYRASIRNAKKSTGILVHFHVGTFFKQNEPVTSVCKGRRSPNPSGGTEPSSAAVAKLLGSFSNL